MEVEALSKRLADLPKRAQREVADLIAALEAQSERPDIATCPPLVEEPFIGLWSGREDMVDSTAWVRRVREREWGHGAE